ncbi:DUF4429 domain-containing protein [Sporolactobacillus terrae]|uniref:SHOCT domain-containing protein n=1 Tax=Sporolactobacillus terrae TaxID=269673 RepID=A0A5K7WT27_9BACL|nr:DUF4429 domain-containing protein [Sporolactobacillus terrae]BBN97452.1 hypothetical protein St703_01570 [Sporolactobacillus terrae]
MKKYVIKHPAKAEITVDENFITIHRKGMMSAAIHGMQGDKKIPLKSLTAIQFKKAGMTNGYIQFAYSGSRESKGGLYDATKDENSVTFWPGNNSDMLELKEYLENKIVENLNKPAETIMNEKSDADELRKFKQLMDDGIISEEEFEAKKKQILGI